MLLKLRFKQKPNRNNLEIPIKIPILTSQEMLKEIRTKTEIQSKMEILIKTEIQTKAEISKNNRNTSTRIKISKEIPIKIKINRAMSLRTNLLKKNLILTD